MLECVDHTVVGLGLISRHRICTRPAWTSAAASASESLEPLASNAAILTGVVPVALVVVVAETGETNGASPYCAAIGTVIVSAPAALIDRVNDPTVVLAVIAGGVATPRELVTT